MAVPVVASFTSDTSLSSGADLIIPKPTGLASGDLCIVICSMDSTTAGDGFVAKAGWTREQMFGAGGTTDVNLTIFSRIADGTEGATETFTENGINHDLWGYWLRITGANTSAPFNVWGTPTEGALTPAAIPGVTTTVADCLAFYALAFDGGDQGSFSVSGTGWTESSEINAGTGSTNNAGCWGTKEMPTAGATGTATVSAATNNDGFASIQFAVAPAGGGLQTITGALFTDTDTVHAGQMNLAMAGALFTDTDAFHAGSFHFGIGGSLYSDTDFFFDGVLSGGEVAVLYPLHYLRRKRRS